MKACSITPYEGDKPYIFISYAHRDSHMVFPILEELDRRGYRVWYDDGVAPGSEWPENIAQHLSNCYLTVSCLSPNYIQSANCRRELTFALSKHKNFLAVMLEPTEMSLGLEMQLSAQLMVMRYNYSNEDAFYRKLCSCPDMAPCLEQPPVAEPAPVAQPVAEKPVAAEKPAEAAVPKKAHENELYLEDCAGIPMPKPLPKKKPKWLPAVIAAVLALVVGAGLLLGGVLGDKDSGGNGGGSDVVAKSKDTLKFANVVVDEGVLEELEANGDATTVSFVNCDFSNVNFNEWSLPLGVTHLTMENCTGLDGLYPAQWCLELYELNLINCGITDEMLAGDGHWSPKLQILNLSGNPEVTTLTHFAQSEGVVNLTIVGTGISDLSDMPFTNLYSVDFSNTPVSDVAPLAAHTNLQSVKGANSGVTNIDALAGLTDVTVLDFSGCNLQRIDGAFGCLRLETLYLSGCGLENIDAFQNCTVLKKVDLSHNNMQYIDCLSKSQKSLTHLNISGNTDLNRYNIEFLVWVTGLKELRMSGVQTDNLSMLDGLTALEVLEANGCGLTSLKGLSSAGKLERVELRDNRLRSYAPLSSATANQAVVDLANNPCGDLSGLQGGNYKVLNLLGTDVRADTLKYVNVIQIKQMNYYKNMEQ